MAAQVRPLQPVKLPPNVASYTPEQQYWRSFKRHLEYPSTAEYPVTHVSCPNPYATASGPIGTDYFVALSGTRANLYSAKSRKPVKSIARFDDIVHGADIRRDGRVMVAGDHSGAVQAFDIGSRAILKTWKEHKQPVWTTKFSPFEMTQIMTASDDRTVRLWELSSDESVNIFQGHQDYVRSGAFMPGEASGLLLSGSYDQTVKLWDPRAGSASVLTFQFEDPVEAVLPTVDGKTVLAAAGTSISVVDLVAGRPLISFSNHQRTITSLSFASNNTRLVSGGLDGHVKVYETRGWNVVTGLKYPSPILSLAVIPVGAEREDRHLAVGLEKGALSIRTRLSGVDKVREREREKEMQALLAGTIDKHDKKKNKMELSGWKRRMQGKDFTGEGADVIIEGNLRRNAKKLKGWQKALHQAEYANALDIAMERKDTKDIVTVLTALRHRSATRTALMDRDEESLQPTLTWLSEKIRDPPYVRVCAEVLFVLLDLYSPVLHEGTSTSKLINALTRRVEQQVNFSELAMQMGGMLDLLAPVGA